MKRFKNFSLLRWLSLALIVSGVLLTVFQLVVFSRMRTSFAPGSVIAGVDVSGLDMDKAAERITQAYSVPVELHFGEAFFQVKPNTLGFSLDLAGMMAAADQARASQPFWPSFWDYLFNQMPVSQEVPLRARIDNVMLRHFLENEVAPRYNVQPEPYVPIPGNVYFMEGKPGIVLDVDRSIELISQALKSPSERVISLAMEKNVAARPSLDNLKTLIAQLIDANGFTGIAEVYLLDLQTGEEMQLAYQNGETLKPDIAFSAYSTIKIPIMIKVFQSKSEPIDQDTFTLLTEMITSSDNDASDALMETVMDKNFGPDIVSEMVRKLGLKNTYISAMFYFGAPALRAVTTPANSRTDVTTEPDPLNQSTASDMASLLDDIYQCSQKGGGTLMAVFPGEISQNECRAMIALLSGNREGTLLEAGLPDGTQIAHKHGYAYVNDVIQSMSDVGLVYTPGGNYILSIFAADTNQIIFNDGNRLFADLSRAVYNYFNLTTQ